MLTGFDHFVSRLACFSLLGTLTTTALAQEAPPSPPTPDPAAPAAPTAPPSGEAAAEPAASAPVDMPAPASSAPAEPPAPAAVPAPPAAAAPPAENPAPAAPPAPKGNSQGGFLDFNFYPYQSKVDTDSVFTLNAFAKLPYGFSYASLLNIANQADKNPFDDTNGYYTEQNLRWALPAELPFDLTAQYNMRAGLDNDRMRFGARVRFDAVPVIKNAFKTISLVYSITFHMLQLDHEPGFVWQMEHIFRLDTPYLDRRLYLAGFVDHTFNQDVPNVPRNPAIVEVQAGVRLIEEFHAIAEYRINQYRVDHESNLGLGAEYVIKW